LSNGACAVVVNERESWNLICSSGTKHFSSFVESLNLSCIMRFKTLQTSYKLTVTGADDTSLLYISRVFLLLFSLYLKSIHTVLPVLATLSADCTSKFGHNLGSSPPSSSLVTTNLLQYRGNCTCIDEGREDSGEIAGYISCMCTCIVSLSSV